MTITKTKIELNFNKTMTEMNTIMGKIFKILISNI